MLSLKQIEFQLYGVLLNFQRLVSEEHILCSMKDAVSTCMDRIQTRRYNIAVVGEFKRGKSSLINAILGMPILPADVTPTTATINRITFGNEPKVTIHYKDNTEKVLGGITELPEYVTKLSEEKSRVAALIREAVISFPAIICQNHVDIIDTPGLGDDEEMTRTTVSILKQIDAAIVVISALSPFDEAETRFVISLLESREITNIVFVVSFMDQIDDDEYDDVFSAIRSRVITNTMKAAKEYFVSQPELLEKTHRIIDNPQIFPVSAKKALKAFVSNDTKVLEDSRIPLFKEQLLSIIIREQCINSVRKSIDLLQDSIQTVIAAQQDEENKIDGEKIVKQQKYLTEDSFVKNAQRIIDEALYSKFMQKAEFSPSKICEDMLHGFINQMSTITEDNNDTDIRQLLTIAAKEAICEISMLIAKHKDENRRDIWDAVETCLSSFPLISKEELVQSLSEELKKVKMEEFNVPLYRLLPTTDLRFIDIISDLRRNLYQELCVAKNMIETYCRRQRLAVFTAFSKTISLLKSRPRNDIELEYGESIDIIRQKSEHLKGELCALLKESECLLDKIVQL